MKFIESYNYHLFQKRVIFWTFFWKFSNLFNLLTFFIRFQNVNFEKKTPSNCFVFEK